MKYILVFIISIGSVLTLFSHDIKTTEASFFTQVLSPTVTTSSNTTSTIAPTSGYFTVSNSYLTAVSTSTALTSAASGILTCKEAVCINVSSNCSLSLIFTRDLRVGDTGIDVVALQKYLVATGLLSMPAGTTYGYFGSKTAIAMYQFQAAIGLSRTSYLDAKTREAFNEKVYNRKICFAYERHDQLDFTLAAKANRSTVASDLNGLGIKAVGGKTFCSSSTYNPYCFNIYNSYSFIGYLPKGVSAVKSAIYLAKFTDRFSKVDYVLSDPSSAFNSVVLLSKTTSTTTKTTSGSSYGTTTTSTVSASTTTGYR